VYNSTSKHRSCFAKCFSKSGVEIEVTDFDFHDLIVLLLVLSSALDVADEKPKYAVPEFHAQHEECVEDTAVGLLEDILKILSLNVAYPCHWGSALRLY
jgi:hypothetical protein